MKEPLLKGALNTSHRNVACTVLFPEPLNGGPAPPDLFINSRLEYQSVEGCFGGGVGWIS
jgi:hypothetical protein